MDKKTRRPRAGRRLRSGDNRRPMTVTATVEAGDLGVGERAVDVPGSDDGVERRVLSHGGQEAGAHTSRNANGVARASRSDEDPAFVSLDEHGSARD